MRKILIVLVALFAIHISSIASATDSKADPSGGQLYAFNPEKIVNGATIQSGRWVMIKLRIYGDKIMNYSFGARDMIGNIIWETCIPTSYRQTSPGLDGNNISREYNYTATLSGNGFSGLKVYF